MEDKARRVRVGEVVTKLESEHKATVEDYYYAAIIFNHGHGEDDLSKAHDYATKSKNMGYFAGITYGGNTWLFAATYDRLQLESSVPKPQKFGTQYSAENNDRMGYVKDWGIIRSTPAKEEKTNTLSSSNALTPEFKQSIVEHAIASGWNANCFFQSFFHTLTAQSPEILNAIKI